MLDKGFSICSVKFVSSAFNVLIVMAYCHATLIVVKCLITKSDKTNTTKFGKISFERFQ